MNLKSLREVAGELVDLVRGDAGTLMAKIHAVECALKEARDGNEADMRQKGSYKVIHMMGKWPSKAWLCGARGDVATYEWADVTCPACLAQRPKEDQ